MIQYFIYFVVLLLGAWMFKLKRPQKLAWLLVASVCFWQFSFPLPLFKSAPDFWVLCVILSEIKNLGSLLKRIQNTLISRLAVLSIIAFIVLYVNSPHYFGSIGQFIRLFSHELISQYFLPIYAFYCIKSEDDMTVVIKWTRRAMYVLTAFGVLNLVMRHAFALDFLMSGASGGGSELAGSYYSDRERFRVQALFFNAFCYGYICLMMFYLHLYARIKGLETKRQALLVMAFGLFGIATCGCRTLIMCWLISLPLFLLCNYSIGRWMRYGTAIIFIFALSWATVPYVQERIDQTISVFDSNSENVQGSSLEMRNTQFLSVMYYIHNHELFGRGKDFFYLDMGWKDSREGLVDQSLQGLEGVYLSYLLERGFVGYTLYLLFYLSLMLYFIRNRQYAKTQCSIAIAILTSYLLFSHFTGELSSLYSTLLLCGAMIAVIEHEKLMIQKTKLS